jgi:tripartite ATP-independent transporter DctM subunit
VGIEAQSLLLLGTLFALLLIGVPFAFALGLSAFAFALALFGEASLVLVATRMYGFLNEFVLVSIPMFILTASIMEKSSLARDLFDAMQTLSRRVPGGVAVQTVGVAVVLAATTGIVGGEIIMLGLVALPQMLRLQYNTRLAIGTICAGGSLGTMIPPSIVLIFFGLAANASIGDLFAAAVIPGLLLAAVYTVYIVAVCLRRPEFAPSPPDEPAASPPIKRLVKGFLFPFLVIFAVLGGIFFGVASVSEAATLGFAVTLIGTAARGELTLQLIVEAAKQALSACGMLIWLTLGASAFIAVYNLMGGIQFLRGMLQGLSISPHEMILLMLLVFLVLGCFIDWLGILLLTMPVFAPIVAGLGFDMVWFGILFCISMQVSYLSPPFGWAAFYLKSVAPPEISLATIFRSVLPFIVLQLIVLGCVFVFPEIALWLPGLSK